MSYTRTAIALHWLIALGIFCALPLGMVMTELKLSPTKLQLYSYHKWLGISILGLVLLRILWRATHTPPPLVAGMARWQRVAAQGAHHALYALMVAAPLSGWLMSSALGVSVVWFGVWPLPDLIGKNKELGEALKTVHAALDYTLLAVVVVHMLGALKHHLIDRDETLTRMLPFLSRR